VYLVSEEEKYPVPCWRIVAGRATVVTHGGFQLELDQSIHSLLRTKMLRMEEER